jgi:hypothetical protein
VNGNKVVSVDNDVPTVSSIIDGVLIRVSNSIASRVIAASDLSTSPFSLVVAGLDGAVKRPLES